MFIRKRLNTPARYKTHTTYQVCETYRAGKQVKQRIICSLGDCDNPQAALVKYSADLVLYKKILVREETKQVHRRGLRAKEKRVAHYRWKVDFLEEKLKKIGYVVSQLSCRRDRLFNSRTYGVS